MSHPTTPQDRVSRRFLLAAGAVGVSQLALAGCTSLRQPPQGGTIQPPAGGPALSGGFDYPSIYAARVDGGYPLPAIPYERVPAQFLRQWVADPTGEAPGTVVVDTASHHLYLVQPGGRALRYGVGLGRAGFEWSGRAVIQWKKAWPTWTPPAEMIARQPELAEYGAENGGMEPGLDNPLGARALYIFQGGEDTLYRVHGSPEWWTIGKSVSSGCVRMMNQDVIDLYDRVPNETPILVRQSGVV